MMLTRLFKILFFLIIWNNHLFAQTVQEYFEAAQRNIELGEFNQAVKNLDMVVSLDSNNAQVFAQRGFVKSNLMILSEAIADYDQSIALNPNDTWVLGNRAKLKIQTGDFKGAIEDFERSIQLNPKDPWSYMMRGEAKYMALKNNYSPSAKISYFSAVDDFSKAVSLDHNFGFAFLRRAQTRLDSLKQDLSIPSVPELEGICDDWLLAANSGVPDAIVELENNCGIRINSFITAKTHKMAILHTVRQEYNKALALYNSLIQNAGQNQNEDITKYLFERGELYFSQGKFYEAIADFSELITSLVKNPDKNLSGKAYYLRALAYNRSNNPDSAIDDLNQAINLGYQLSWVYYERGVAYNMVANKEAACQDWGVSATKGNTQAQDLLKENCKTGFSLFKKKKN